MEKAAFRILLGACLVAACAHAPQPSARPTIETADVVFVCEHGAAKSVLASAYFNRLAAKSGSPLRATPRGAAPQEALSTTTLAGMTAEGLRPDVDAPLAVETAQARTRLIAFDCGLPAMQPVNRTDCWDDVPLVGEGYAKAREAIRIHVEALFQQLGSNRVR